MEELYLKTANYITHKQTQETKDTLKINYTTNYIRVWLIFYLFSGSLYLSTFFLTETLIAVSYILMMVVLILFSLIRIKIIKDYSNMEAILYEMSEDKNENFDENSLSERKWKWVGAIVIFAVLVNLPICALLGNKMWKEINEIKKQQTQEYTTGKDVLSANEYTDGIITFTKPTIFSIGEMLSDNNTPFFKLLHPETMTEINIFGVYDNTELTEEYFEEAAQGCSDDNFADFDFNIAFFNHYNSNGSIYYIKKLEYHTEPYYEWTFAIVSNKETGKYCVISCWSEVKEDLEDEILQLIETVRF